MLYEVIMGALELSTKVESINNNLRSGKNKINQAQVKEASEELSSLLGSINTYV